MANRRARSVLIILIALILFSVPIIAPLAELLGTHNHTCSVNCCPLCPLLNTLRVIRDLYEVSFFVLLPFIILITRASVSVSNPTTQSDTPIGLKTKILS